MTEVTKEQLDGLRTLAEDLSGKKLGNIKDPVKLQAIIDMVRAEEQSKQEAAKSKQMTKHQLRKQQEKEAMKLVRVRVTPMSPYYKQMSGANFTAGNSIVGNVTRHIRFNEPWHIEEIMLEMLRNKQYRTKVEKKDPVTRRTVYDNQHRTAFGIEVLPDLNANELHQLADSQRARQSID